MKTEIGSLQKHGEFILNGEKYKILGLCSSRSYNNVLCQNIETKKRKWLDIDTEVEHDSKHNEIQSLEAKKNDINRKSK